MESEWIYLNTNSQRESYYTTECREVDCSAFARLQVVNNSFLASFGVPLCLNFSLVTQLFFTVKKWPKSEPAVEKLRNWPGITKSGIPPRIWLLSRDWDKHSSSPKCLPWKGHLNKQRNLASHYADLLQFPLVPLKEGSCADHKVSFKSMHKTEGVDRCRLGIWRPASTKTTATFRVQEPIFLLQSINTLCFHLRDYNLPY